MCIFSVYIQSIVRVVGYLASIQNIGLIYNNCEILFMHMYIIMDLSWPAPCVFIINTISFMLTLIVYNGTYVKVHGMTPTRTPTIYNFRFKEI